MMACATPTDIEGPNPNGPPGLADFGFAIGDWTYVTTAERGPSGEPLWDKPIVPPGIWSFRYTLDGWAVRDEFTQPLGDGTDVQATSLRAFDPQAGKWRVRGVVTGYPGWDEFDVERIGNTVVMTGSSARVAAQSGGKILERITFYDFTPNSWKRKGEQSADSGETWSDDVVFSLATRVGSQ